MPTTPEFFALCLYWHGPTHQPPNAEYPMPRCFAKLGTAQGETAPGGSGCYIEFRDDGTAHHSTTLSASTIWADAVDWLADNAYSDATPFGDGDAEYVLGLGLPTLDALRARLAPGASLPLPDALAAQGYACTVVASVGIDALWHGDLDRYATA